MSINQDCPCTRAFFFADGRRCQLPPSADDMGLCNFHAKKYRDRITAEEAGRQISESLSNDVLTACDLSSALNTLFSATAQGYIKPKTAATLAYRPAHAPDPAPRQTGIPQILRRSLPKIVHESICFNPPVPAPAGAESPVPSESGPSDNPDADPTATGIHPLPSRKIM
jgi:hypothetical protein